METSFDSERLPYSSDSERMTVSDSSDHCCSSNYDLLSSLSELSDPFELSRLSESAVEEDADGGWNLWDNLSDSEHYDPPENVVEDDESMLDWADEQPVSVPLYEGCSTTMSEAMLLVLQYSLRCAILSD